MSLVPETDYGTPRSKAPKTVTLTIDGQAVTVPEGTSVWDAAKSLGVAITSRSPSRMKSSGPAIRSKARWWWKSRARAFRSMSATGCASIPTAI